MSDLSTQVCTGCRLAWPLDQFYHSKKHRQCRSCVKAQHKTYYRSHKADLASYGKAYHARTRNTISTYLRMLWGSLNSRTINGSCPRWSSKSFSRYLKQGIRLEVTRDELRTIVTEWWDRIQAMRAAGQTPSIDRIDANGHYSRDNIRFIPRSENSRRVKRVKKIRAVNEDD